MWKLVKATPPQEDAVIEAAMRSAPLASPPPLLYASIMRQVRLHPRPAPFRVHWLDAALSLIFSAMLGAAAWALTRLDPQTVEYARLWLEYYRLSLVYLHPEVLLALGVALALSIILLMVGISLAPSFNRPQS